MVFAGLVGIVGQRVKLVPLVESSGFVVGLTQEVVGFVVVVVERVVLAGFLRGFAGANPMLLLSMSNSV